MSQLNDQPRVVGFVCEWSVKLDGHVQDNGALTDMPNVKVIEVPCTGFIKPGTVELALKNGADGVFICGCPSGDCHYREGNLFIKARVLDQRQPRLRKEVDRSRVAMFWLGGPEAPELLKGIREFAGRLKSLGGKT
jgi:F420-non-reducing hydrogenase iron-sulfur subunit